jgi:hypothetical protein
VLLADDHLVDKAGYGTRVAGGTHVEIRPLLRAERRCLGERSRYTM